VIDNEDNWSEQLLTDLKRVNKLIDQVRTEVEEGIETLKLLTKERERILDESLNTDQKK